ncbi:MAG: methyltransferase domain-containing protein [Methylobacter sp.]|jgi:phosphatidylethanolamine/phosphatidyl-N-methylethanolamine N-methyltransferase|uniref:class I SAM-dependent methyltransferase n=1 Tax=Methylobacter TaxID=429 RepID=UPI00039BC37A|nr:MULTISPECIES: class I SAM-dependent methyltransferase [Methylobacter]MCL7420053.1 methyltransferase domain-containing protein [Methylobacter sp.]
MKPDSAAIKKRYDRIAPYFDGMEAVVEGLLFKSWRERLWDKVNGHHILEIGVGTGKNFDYYPKDARITGIDFSEKMLTQAKRKRDRKQVNVDLELMDVQSLCFADNSFDTVIGSFVFCSVPSPVKGLKELYRVCKPGGQVLLLEHVLSSKPVIAGAMNLLNPLVVALVGANINRQTVKNVQACAFGSVRVDERSSDIIKLIEAKK